jgi:hypothetical protein
MLKADEIKAEWGDEEPTALAKMQLQGAETRETKAIRLRAEAAELREQKLDHMKWQRVNEWEYGRHEGQKRVLRVVANKEPVCPICGEPVVNGYPKENFSSIYHALERKPLKCRAPKKVWDPSEEKWVYEYRTESGTVKPICGEPLWQFKPEMKRWPLAKYISDHLPGFFKCFIPDEVHQYKAKDSDQGWAFAVLASAIEHTITLTGTFFGGYSTSIFYLLFRTQENIKQHFDFDGAGQWAEQFGVLETKFKVEDDTYSAHNARKKRRLGTKEKPGLAPAAVQFFLSTAVFGRLKELGIPLPPYKEEIQLIPMSPAQENDYNACWDFTWDKLLEWRPRYTSSWIQWCLARSNSCFRDELVECSYDNDELELPAVVKGNERLPKEKELVQLVTDELGKGRKVVVYLRQTGTRDIRDRIKEVLEHAGVGNVTILKESVQPRKREAWLKKNGGDVLITNPKLVETGLDLVKYSTIVFYEVEYSLYTLWQAMRRVWRPGQTKPVRVLWFVNEGTLEEKAMVLIGQKLKAGQLVHGDDVTSALVEDSGSGSLVEDLIAAIQEEEALSIQSDDWRMFEDEEQDLKSDAVWGSMIRESTPVPTSIDEFLERHGVNLDQVAKKRKKKVEVPEAQMALF